MQRPLRKELPPAEARLPRAARRVGGERKARQLARLLIPGGGGEGRKGGESLLGGGRGLGKGGRPPVERPRPLQAADPISGEDTPSEEKELWL